MESKRALLVSLRDLCGNLAFTKHSLVRLGILWVGVLPVGGSQAAEPKYGPNASPLSAGTQLEFFQKNAAPDFWVLIPYYIPQKTGSGCSAATMTMILNAARSKTELTQGDRLITFDSFVDEYSGNSAYQKVIRGKFSFSLGNVLSNPSLRGIFENAAKKLGLFGEKSKIELQEVDPANREASKKAFLEALLQNEKSSDDLIFFSYIQGTVTGDPEGGAHVAAIAAFEAKKKRVLVLDPDRDGYEPYWTSVDTLFESIADPRSDSAKKPGWIRFQIR